MKRLSFKAKCPKCGSFNLTRVKRTWWERLIPFSKRMLCYDCHRRFISF